MGDNITRPLFAIFDLDGVLRQWPKSDADLEARYSLPPGSISSVAFSPGLLPLALNGAISDTLWRSSIASGLSAQHQIERATAVDAVAEWSAATGIVNMDVLQVVRELRRVAKVAIFTNATNKVLLDLGKLSLISEVDAILYSSDLGFSKPSPESFHETLRRLGVSANEVVFVDDTAANVDAASAVGIVSHLYTSPSALAVFLRACNLPVGTS